ncbi:hypothetical protein [Nocardia cyriacigeorgica]|uniref:Uncharacterized protein n=1 Tax=Nocardia cyriacigeorgica TaxID=135487 RepID=A0A5R8NM77_9NOCA|nr:hypothetical protein [Nocardia cyriacigeorgica]TLF76782.1 hypothetical protein FEK34_18020 [Nocardia cyriacigeorgica]
MSSGTQHTSTAVGAPPRAIAISAPREVLDYFGKCPACGYPANAIARTVTYSDGSTRELATGTCGLPCGWSGPVELTTMTGPRHR